MSRRLWQIFQQLSLHSSSLMRVSDPSMSSKESTMTRKMDSYLIIGKTMFSVIVKIGRDPPLNGSSCCESLFSSIPFLTDQVEFSRANIQLAHI